MTTTVASLAEMPSSRTSELVDQRADWIEVRADLLDAGAVGELVERFARRVIYTLRSHAEGGSWQGCEEERFARLAKFAAQGCLVDLEIERDTDSRLLAQVPVEQRLWSWHGAFAGVPALQNQLQKMSTVGGRIYKLVPETCCQQDSMAVFSWLAQQDQSVAAFATGAAATWTRVLASRWGSGWIYLSVGRPTAVGQISLDRWFSDGYHLTTQRPTQIFGIVGSPVAHSLSPRIHNTAYRELNLDLLYLPFEVPDFAEFWLEVVESEHWQELGCDLVGFSVTAPHKSVALAVAGATSPLAQYTGSANTLVKDRGVWEAEVTDPDGVRVPLQQRGIELRGARCVVVGAGGAGRAAVVALRQAGAEVTVVNRSADRGRRVAERFQVPFVPMDEFNTWNGQDVVVLINTTAVGKNGEPPPFGLASLAEGGCVVDMVYRESLPHGLPESAERSPTTREMGALETELIRQARERGFQVINGREVLLAQAVLQFRMMTGHDLPMDSAGRALGLASGLASRLASV